MAKITNIKTRDGAVHPIALPFATCDTAAAISPKELTFSCGDTPTELVNGQQIMVQFAHGSQTESTFSVKITNGASITYTVPVVLNSSDTSVAPYIGEGAVVNLTYNNNNFYLSNAAALTGFEVPTDITLATITNAGGTIDLITNAGIIGEKREGIVQTDKGIFNQSAGTIWYEKNEGKIEFLTNATCGSINTLTNRGTITTIDNIITDEISSTITTLNNTADIGTVNNSGTITTINNNENGNISTFDNKSNSHIDKIYNKSSSAPAGSLGGISDLYNRAGGVIDDLFNDNNGTINYINNKGTIGRQTDVTTYGITNDATGHILYVSNDGTVDKINNNNQITTINNSGTIGTAGSTVNGLKNTGTIYHLSNSGQIGQDGLTYGFINQNDGIVSYEKNWGLLKTLTNGTLATITNLYNHSTITNLTNEVGGTYNYAGKIETLDNKYKITTLKNSGTVSAITNTGTITKINNASSGNIGTSGSTINGIFNGSSATIHYVENNGKIVTFKNNSITGESSNATVGIQNAGTIYYISNSGQIGQDGLTYGFINQSAGTVSYEKNWGLLKTLTNGVGATLTNLHNHGTITTLANHSTITTLNNGGTVSLAINTGIFEKINNTTGTIGVSGSTTNGIFNGSTATIYYVENSGKVVTFKNKGTTGDSGDATTGVQNNGNLHNITNSSGGTIYQLNNAANIKTITIGTANTFTGPGLVDQITNWSGDTPNRIRDYTPTKGIDHFTNKGRIKTLENTGDIGFAGTLNAVPSGYSPTGNYYDANTGIKNTGKIHNIQNDCPGSSHPAVIRHIANYGGGTAGGGISLFENGGDLSYLVNVPAVTGASGIPGGNIGEIINTNKINKITNKKYSASDGGTITEIVSIGASTTYQAYIGTINNAYSTINEINNGWSGYQHGHIETINNWSAEGAGGGINNIYNQPGGVIDDIYNGSTLSSTLSVITSIQNAGRIGDTNYGGHGINNTGIVNNIQNSGTITLIGSSGTISTLNNQGTITTLSNSKTITTLTNSGSIDTLNNSRVITTLNNTGKINTLTGGTITNIGSLSAFLPTIASWQTRIKNNQPIQNGIWQINPFNSLRSVEGDGGYYSSHKYWTPSSGTITVSRVVCNYYETEPCTYGQVDGKDVEPWYIHANGDDVLLVYRGYTDSGKSTFYFARNITYNSVGGADQNPDKWWGNSDGYKFGLKYLQGSSIAYTQFILQNDNWNGSSTNRTIYLKPRVRRTIELPSGQVIATSDLPSANYIQLELVSRECALITLVRREINSKGYVFAYKTTLSDGNIG